MPIAFLSLGDQKYATQSNIINVFININLTYIVKSVNFWLNV